MKSVSPVIVAVFLLGMVCAPAAAAAETELEAATGKFKSLYEKGDYAAAIDAAQAAGRIASERYGDDSPEMAACAHNLAEALAQQGFLQDAEKLLVLALSINEKKFGGSHAATASDINSLGKLYADMGRYEDAEPLLQRSLKICDRVFGPDDSRTRAVRRHLADVHHHTGAATRGRAEEQSRGGAGPQ